MTASVADIFEDYVESLQNLPSEIDQNMHELRSMDEEFQRFKDIYSKHRRTYAKLYKTLNNNSGNTATENTTARQQIEKDYCLAVQKQDQKIELTKRMYELVNKHIERIDSQMTRSDLGDIEWIRSSPPKNSRTNISSAVILSYIVINRTHHSFRPNPTLNSQFLSEMDSDPYEPKYCYCNQVSYGDMVACDGENCEKEWFHYACVGLTEPPIGKWYCEYCSKQDRYKKKIKKEHTISY
ncbi:hypothetical protein BDF20DRAFT_830407 [Mycotypha africana]|uniref:uncharacterized protein n=1 Tax=Mycotypha africana TaxID=64632 RepID=UPI002300C0CB|nr:uncharacterized protein BDF20DRAFT_830407 [Mycotypha africana]KAI8967016.1 hypothetical protein BDF20DRAFT_830407 [Mycotypha africana]